MKIERIVILGGSGFVGTALANRLSEFAIVMIVPTRRAARANHLAMLPTVDIQEADIHDQDALVRLFEDADAVVNLVGTLHSRSGSPYGPGFRRAHVELPQKIVAACRAAGVPRLIHVSALGASVDAPSEYQRSKAAGEAEIRAAGESPAWTILRPSVMFGPHDHFLGMFAQLSQRFPIIPLACSDARFQPVYVEDVVSVIWHCLCDPQTAGQIYELAGPKVYTLRQLVEYVSELVGAPRPILPLPDGLARLQAGVMERMPSPLLTRDNLRSMEVDNVASGEPLPFGITPTPIEGVVPTYIGDKSYRARYYPMRIASRRAAR